MYAGTYIFKNQKINSIITTKSNVINALAEKDTSVSYRIYNINTTKTIAFSLDENIEFVDANTSCGSYDYDANNHTLYWQVDGLNSPKDISLKVRPKTKGNFTIRSYTEDLSDDMNVTIYASNYGAIIKSDDIEVYKGYSSRLIINLTDLDGRSLTGENISIQIGKNT